MKMRHIFRATLVEHGFFHPPASCPVGIGSNGDLHHPLKGITKHIQFFHVSLANVQTGVTQLHMVLSTGNAKISENQVHTFRGALRRHFPEVKPSFMVDRREGWVRVSTEEPYAEAAAANAFVRLVAAWDESDPIVVMFDGVALAASQQFSDGSWVVELAQSSNESQCT